LKVAWKAEGKIVMTRSCRIGFPTTPLGHRYNDEELQGMVPEVLPTEARAAAADEAVRMPLCWR